MWDEIKIVAEGQSLLQEKMDTGFKEVSGRIDSLENEMSLLKDEMQAGFKTLIAGSVEDGEKFATKADKKDLILLEKRVEKLETAK